jgi:glutamine amidotransferase
MIGIIDYGVGNLGNVKIALDRLGVESAITGDVGELADADALLLPGVGAFGDSVDRVNSTGIRAFLDSWVDEGKPLLGICVGMQMLFEKSHEFGEHAGLGYLKGEVARFDSTRAKVPHMGWNELETIGDDPILEGVANGEYVYFVHSFYAEASSENLVAYANYAGVKASAIVRKGSVYGVQFHPEKSARTGLRILSNFLESTR